MASTLRLGNCLDLLPDIPDASVDMLLVDLPYGTTACKWDSIIPLDELWTQYNRVCKKNAAMVFTAQQPFTTTLAASNLANLKYEWIWEKNRGTNPMGAKYMPMKCHENVLVFYRKTPTYNPVMWYSTPYGGFSSDKKQVGEVYGNLKSQHRDNPDGSRYPRSVQKWSQEKGYHPTQKPVSMMEYLIKTYTNEGDTVLDNTMGSGTTGVAAANLKRNFIGMELDPEYYGIAVQRIEEVENQSSLDEFLTNC